MDRSFKKYRMNMDGKIDLIYAYTDLYGRLDAPAASYLTKLTELYPIASRQVAALALVTANELSKKGALVS